MLCLICVRLWSRGAQDYYRSDSDYILRTCRHPPNLPLPLQHGQCNGRVLPTVLQEGSVPSRYLREFYISNSVIRL